MRRTAAQVLMTIAAAVMAVSIAAPADAQSLGERLRKRAEEAAKRKAEERTERRAGEAADKALDRAECAASDKLCQERAAQAAQQGNEGTGAGGEGASAAVSMKPGEGAWANYDFVPGEKPLYVDDFARDVVGDFPRRMEFQSGQLELVEWNGARWLRASEDSRFYVVSPTVLPSRYTFEFDYSIPSGEVWITFGPQENARLVFTGDGRARLTNNTLRVAANGSYASVGERNRVRRARVLVDGAYVKVYIDDKRILNVPNASLERTNKINFYTDADPERPTLFTNFSLMAGGRKLYDAIAESGRVATQGIYFATGSDVIRPESSPTLKEIATMLTEHPELNLTIEGHTDNVGAAAANQSLSEKRAAAVKAMLVASYGVDAARLATKGLGATKPAAPNTTDEGRQQNRRVELVKR